MKTLLYTNSFIKHLMICTKSLVYLLNFIERLFNVLGQKSFWLLLNLQGRFPQICTVCYSVTFKIQKIRPWRWSTIIHYTLSVCTNNIQEHIGSPPGSFINFWGKNPTGVCHTVTIVEFFTSRAQQIVLLVPQTKI